MSKYNIAIDSGKYETKGIIALNNNDSTKDKLLRFRTTVTKTEKDVSSFGMSVVLYEGNKYLVGEPTQRMHDPNSSKDTLIHRISIYTAVAKLLNGVATDNPDVNLAIGCPLEIFTNAGKKESYLENMLPIGKKICITVDGKEISFTIVSHTVLPECAGIIFLDSKSYRSDIVNIIDIGGLNANGCQFDSLTPIIPTMFTENFGGNTVVSDLRDALVNKGFERAKLADNILEKALRDGSIRTLPDSSEMIRNLKMSKAEMIYRTCEEKNWALDMVDTKFLGGASLLLKDELKTIFHVGDDSFINDPVFANVKGFLKVLRTK